MTARDSYIPDRGDVIWIDMMPQAGHEQSGRRPALVLSPASYNGKTGLAILCPLTSQIKGYPFVVVLPEELRATGCILADQVRNLDWRARNAAFHSRVPLSLVEEVLAKLATLLTP